jgi:putative ABC transport system substrate-binding protein
VPHGGLIVLPDVSTVHHRDRSSRWRRATACRRRPYRFYAVSGAHLAGSDVADVFRGRRPMSTASSRVRSRVSCRQAPTKYETVVNLKTAKALGLELADAACRADELIEDLTPWARLKTPRSARQRAPGLENRRCNPEPAGPRCVYAGSS